MTALLLACTTAGGASNRHRHPCGTTRHPVKPWVCAKRLSKSWYGWTGEQWLAEAQLIRNESGWDPCAHYPSTHDCYYDGPNACGLPQFYYCPEEWRGHLYLWKRQVFALLRRIHDRWDDPIRALYAETHGGY